MHFEGVLAEGEVSGVGHLILQSLLLLRKYFILDRFQQGSVASSTVVTVEDA